MFSRRGQGAFEGPRKIGGLWIRYRRYRNSREIELILDILRRYVHKCGEIYGKFTKTQRDVRNLCQKYTLKYTRGGGGG